ncbi:hypothetical protein TrST_g7230 [Triparma strigata]|uniref:Uncharacterized protein n=1 Tax=Triparma strigata TaxID=1606541 RepID=A0A9W6ZX19_9STRA|nr:hypothetical protein TrST_g7230 [Triparma strigata]
MASLSEAEVLGALPDFKKLAASETPSSLLAKALRRSRREESRARNKIGASSKLRATGGESLKVGSGKYAGQKTTALASSRLYNWFSEQASALLLSKYAPPPSSSSSSSCHGNWGSTINIVTAYDRCDYITEHGVERKGGGGNDGGSLEIIFSFYAKLQKPGVQRMKKSLTYTEINDANSTLSYFESLCGMRDFDVVPNLVTREDFDCIWKWCKARRGRRSTPESVISELEFGDFLELLSCISLVAFSRPGMVDLVSCDSASHSLACAEKIVRFLRLDNFKHVQNVIRTRGKETSRRFNYRSVGEVDMDAPNRLKKERDVARAATLISHAKEKVYDDGSQDDRDSVIFKGFNDHDTVNSSRYRGDETKKVWETIRGKVVNPGRAGERKGKGGGSRVGFSVECEDDDDDFEDREDREEKENFTTQMSQDDLTFANSFATMKTTASTTSFWSGTDLLNKRTLGVDHAETLKMFNQAMCEILRPYKRKIRAKGKADWVTYKGPWIDFGSVSRGGGGGYKAIISITNTSTEPVLVTPSVYKFDKRGRLFDQGEHEEDEEDMKEDRFDTESGLISIQFKPAVVPPGLRTSVSVTVDPRATERGEVLGGINLCVGVVPREQGKAERKDVAKTQMRKKQSLQTSFNVKVPIYSRFVDERFSDRAGRYELKARIEDVRCFQRAGIKIKSKNKANGNKFEVDYITIADIT